jgi:hypothetical protein
MDPYLPEEVFNPMTGEWIGRGRRPEPAPELWAQIWGIEWPPAKECESDAALGLSSDLFQFEAACFGIGVAIGIPARIPQRRLLRRRRDRMGPACPPSLRPRLIRAMR